MDPQLGLPRALPGLGRLSESKCPPPTSFMSPRKVCLVPPHRASDTQGNFYSQSCFLGLSACFKVSSSRLQLKNRERENE